jgi:hypothetical protein
MSKASDYQLEYNKFFKGVPTYSDLSTSVSNVNKAYKAVSALTEKSTAKQRSTAETNLQKAKAKLDGQLELLQSAIGRLPEVNDPYDGYITQKLADDLQLRINRLQERVLSTQTTGVNAPDPNFRNDYMGWVDSLVITDQAFGREYVPEVRTPTYEAKKEEARAAATEYSFEGKNRQQALDAVASWGTRTDAYKNAVAEINAQYDWTNAAASYAQSKGITLPDNFPTLVRLVAADAGGLESVKEPPRNLFSNLLTTTSGNKAMEDFVRNPQQFVDYFANNKQDFYSRASKAAAYNLLDDSVFASNKETVVPESQKLLNQTLTSAVQSGVSPEQAYALVDDAQARFVADYEKNKPDNTIADTLIGFGQAAIFSALTGVPKTIGDVAVATALNSAKAYMEGANTEQIVRAAVGSLAASQVPKYLTEFKKVIGAGEVLSSAIDNAAVQAVYSTVTEQDVLKNALAGALGGTVTELARIGGFDDPLYQKTLGEYTKYRALGLSAQDAALLATSDYAGDLSAEAGRKPVTEGMAAVSPRKGAQIGDPLAGVGDINITVPSEIASLEQFKTMPGETGTNIYKVTEQDGTVTYQKIISGKFPDGGEFGYTIQFDPQTNSFSYEYSTGAPGAENYQVVSKKSRPVEGMPVEDVARTLTPPRLAGLQGQRMQGADYGFPATGGGGRAGAAPGADAGEGGTLPAVEVTAPVEEMPTLALLRRVRTGEETAPDAITRTLPAVEVTGQRPPEEEVPETQRLIQPAETEGTRRADEQEEPIAQRQPTESVILDLISGGANAQRAARTQRTPDERELASMQALSQALRIGDPGEPLFGGRLGRRRNVWNVESLRLKDELGG